MLIELCQSDACVLPITLVLNIDYRRQCKRDAAPDRSSKAARPMLAGIERDALAWRHARSDLGC